MAENMQARRVRRDSEQALMVDELQDITFNQSMAIIVQGFLHLTDDQINSLFASFVSRLSAYLRDFLHIAQAV